MPPPPDISVVIPTCNRPDALRACLEALARLDYRRDRFEVLVVDDGSATTLDAIIRDLQPRLPVRLIRQQNAGPAAARNHGARQARGRFLAFTDDDCAPRPNWLSALADALEHEPDALVGGPAVNALPQNLCATASQHLVSYLCGYFNTPQGACFLTSNNMAVARDTLAAHGGFDTRLRRAAGEDRELCDRWVHLGLPVRFVDAAVVDHAHPLTLRRFWRQHSNYGRGAWHFHRVRAQRQADAMGREPLRFYRDLVLYPFRREPLARALPLAALLFLSQAANALGYYRERFAASRGKGVNDAR